MIKAFNSLIEEPKNNNEDSFVWDILKFVISIITLLLFLAFMWKWNNESFQEESTKLEGYEVIRYTKSCIDGKQFINGGRGITINLDMDGKPIPCNLKE